MEPLAAGLELVANGRLTAGLTYSVNADVYWDKIQSANLNVATASRSAVGLSGRANLDWQVTRNDLLQLNVYTSGKHLLAQGFNEPNSTLNLGWRRRFGDRLTLTATAQDILASNHFERRVMTSILHEHFEVHPVSRALIIRLDYRFGRSGGKGAREPGFEYENGPPPPG